MPSPKIAEAEFQQQVIDLCKYLGLDWYHNPDSRRSNSGFPDLVILGDGGMIFLELKTEKGRVSAEQQRWHDRLRLAGQDAYIVRPGQLPSIKARLEMLKP